MPYTLHPEIGATLVKVLGTEPPPPLAPGDVNGRRERFAGLFALFGELLPKVTDVETKDLHVKADDGKDILCRWYTKQNSSLPGSAVVYAHGGGMILSNVTDYDPMVKRYVSRTGVPFLSVEYRLAPEHPAPIPVTDTYAGLKYLQEHASEMGVDPKRIAIAGDSGGGGIAASLAHYAKEKGGPAICKQILIYPMLDDRTASLDEGIAPYASWTVDDNVTAWRALLGDRYAKDSVPAVHAAGRMTVEQAKGLPPAYIDVGELDLFAKEDIKYMSMLTEAGVACEFHLIPHITHAAQDFCPEADFARTTMDLRCAAFKSF